MTIFTAIAHKHNFNSKCNYEPRYTVMSKEKKVILG